MAIGKFIKFFRNRKRIQNTHTEACQGNGKSKNMSTTETYYLIDFENVNEDGLSCSKNLGSHDHIHIFSTENTPKISFEILSSFNATKSSSHIVPAGKQSLDMHLVSYLGYLIGKNSNNKCKYVVVSKDTDYDNVISFLKKLSPSSAITRQTRIDSASKRNSVQNSAAAKTSNTTITAPQNKSQLNTKIQRAISDAGYARSTINSVASIVVKHYGKDNFASNVHNELKKTYPDYYSDIYKIVKPIISQRSSSSNKTNTASQHDNEIHAILSKANFNNDIISYVASLYSKHRDEKNAKQAIYRAIVAKYGQKQGLNIYNHIKKNL